ncbi:MAG: hypothetical protein NC123_20230 [Butyrivibrio sp.]|nr:hypothetical protein [Butyrivibrio sp.]
MIKVKDVIGNERECSYVKMQVIINFLDASGKKYDAVHAIYGTDSSTSRVLTTHDYMIDAFEDYEAALDYFVRLKFAVDQSEESLPAPDSLPFP